MPKKPKGRKPRAQTLPTMEDRAIQPLHDAALAYAETRDERMELRKAEVAKKGVILAQMKRLGRKTYRFDGVDITVIEQAEDVKVKIHKHADNGD